MSDARKLRLLTTAIAAGVAVAGAARAQAPAPTGAAAGSPDALARRVDDLERKLREQQAVLDQQTSSLTAQSRILRDQQSQISRLNGLRSGPLDELRAGGPGDASAAPAAAYPAGEPAAPATQEIAQAAPPPGSSTPVGEAPPAEPTANLNAALPPETTGVLTRAGHFTVEPSIAYSLSSSDRLVFRGVEIVTGIQIGVIEADTAERSTAIGTLTGRYGLTSRSEVEVKVPYVWRRDTVTTLQQRDASISNTFDLSAANLGDVEVTGRYQLNGGSPMWPVIVANVRVKSDSGTNPYTVRRDQFGVAQGLATGSGFWAVEPSMSFLFVSDPAVLFGNISYLHSFPRTIGRTVGEVRVGRVTPGDSPGVSMGFGFSLNPNFSFSLAYRHNYIFGTTTELGTTRQKSTALQVGSLLFGMSYALNPHYTLNAQVEMGVTKNAPDVTLTFRTPIAF